MTSEVLENDDALLRIKGLTKMFPGTLALDNVDMEIYGGEVHALLGENGAGKSTLIKILDGIFSRDAGELFLNGEKINDINRLRVSVIHQDLGLIDSFTVAENIALGAGYIKHNGIISWRTTEKHAKEVLDKINCDIDPRKGAFMLSAAEKSMVAISRAISKKTKILLLDEPTATLPQNDVDKLFDIIRTIKKTGVAVVYVTHRIDEVFELADKVTVLRNGRVVAKRRIKDTNEDELIFDIIGKEPSEVFLKESDTNSNKCVLEVKDLDMQVLKSINFKLYEGQILSFFGLRGAGHHEAGRTLFGLYKPEKGKILINGKERNIDSPFTAMKLGFAFVSSKRHEEELAPNFTVRENIYINPVKKSQKLLSIISRKKEKRNCMKVLDRFTVRPRETERIMGTLSGGNQQKTVLARWFEMDSKILILEEPTMGVDVGAKAEIYLMMQQALKEKKSIILISSDHEEVVGVSQKVLVFNRGRIIEVVEKDDITSDTISRLAAGEGGNNNG